MAAFDPSNPQAFFSNLDNLSPAYTNDPTQAASQLQNMQAALAWAQANPGDPNASYYVSQLTPAIQEQQNISTYLGDASGITTAQQNLQQSQKDLSRYTDPNNGYALWLHESNTPNDLNAYGKYQAFINQTKSDITNLTNAVNNGTTKQATDQGNYQNNIMYAQPNYAGNDAALGQYWNTVQQNVVAPQQQDIYQTAYNIKNNIAEKMNLTGQLGSGAAIKEQGLVNSDALQKDTTLQNNYNTQKQTSLAGQQTADQQAQNAYQADINSQKGQQLGTSLAGSASGLANAYNANTQTQLQQAQNNANTQLQQTQQQDSTLNEIGSDLSGLAGTVVGSKI